MRRKTPADYEVGFGKPPKHAQFKKGQSGNPRGRKRQPRSVDERIQAILDRPVQTASGDTIRFSDAALNVAMNGLLDRTKSPKASLEIINLLRQFDTKIDFEPTAGDAKRLQRLIDTVRRSTEQKIGKSGNG